jgi:hypothetical protein
VLADAVPTLSADLSMSAKLGLASFGSGAIDTDDFEQRQISESLHKYAQELRQELGLPRLPDDVAALLVPPASGYPAMSDIAKRRATFEPITKWFQENLNVQAISPERLTELRLGALRESGFDERGVLTSMPPSSVDSAFQGDNPRPLLLESEIVAIYW